MTNLIVITDEQLRFLNENLDLVAEYLRNSADRAADYIGNSMDLIVTYLHNNDYRGEGWRSPFLTRYDNFSQISHVTLTCVGDIWVSVHVVCCGTYDCAPWGWQPMLAYVEEHTHRTPIFKSFHKTA